jgi:hypothetical protein
MMITCPKCSNKFPLNYGSCNACEDKESIKPEHFNIQAGRYADEIPRELFREVPNASTASTAKVKKRSFFSAPVVIIGFSLALAGAIFLFNGWTNSQVTASKPSSHDKDYNFGYDKGLTVVRSVTLTAWAMNLGAENTCQHIFRNYYSESVDLATKSNFTQGCLDALAARKRSK